ncbi:hypothetical protein [Devosia sp.]|uniref:hypothetical protein n=1 Tax=Devosia sp. TaxID=1871048 RepID=UPI002F23914D
MMEQLSDRIRKLEIANEIRNRIAEQSRLQDVPYALEALEFYSSDSVMDLGDLGAYQDIELKRQYYRELHKTVTFQLHYKFGRIHNVDPEKSTADGTYVFLELPITRGKATFYIIRGEMQLKQEDGLWKLGQWDQRLASAPYDEGWANTEPIAAPTSMQQ